MYKPKMFFSDIGRPMMKCGYFAADFAGATRNQQAKGDDEKGNNFHDLLNNLVNLWANVIAHKG